jgi:hypothetical protein
MISVFRSVNVVVIIMFLLFLVDGGHETLHPSLGRLRVGDDGPDPYPSLLDRPFVHGVEAEVTAIFMAEREQGFHIFKVFGRIGITFRQEPIEDSSASHGEVRGTCFVIGADASVPFSWCFDWNFMITSWTSSSSG